MWGGGGGGGGCRVSFWRVDDGARKGAMGDEDGGMEEWRERVGREVASKEYNSAQTVCKLCM